MTLIDAVGLGGVGLVLAAYAGAALGRWPATGAVALLANLIGAGLILLSMVKSFNLPAFAMEASWALVALAGLIRLAVTRRRGAGR